VSYLLWKIQCFLWKKSYEFTDKIPVIKEIDIKFLKATKQFSIGDFKNSDIRDITGLNANQVYYRLTKFKGYFSHTGKFWTMTAMGLKLIVLKIGQIGDYLGTYNFFTKAWKGPGRNMTIYHRFHAVKG